MILRKPRKLQGEITVPGDKSISHRAVMFGALAKGTTEATHFLQSADCLSTIQCFSKMGIEIENNRSSGVVRVKGKGLHGLSKPSSVLDVGNSGTTMRLMSGILAGQSFSTVITGDESIVKRPMGRVITPLTLMGGHIKGMEQEGFAPLLIEEAPKGLTGITYNLPVASAQIKSAVLLAGMYADRETSVIESSPSRNHTEIMLRTLGAAVVSKDKCITITPQPELLAEHIQVPGDISSAAYFIAAGLLVPNSEILLKNVGLNPTRDGIIRVCQQMGADITISNVRNKDLEAVGDILIRSSELKGTVIEGDLIPALIDEIPVIAVMACFAKGTTIIKDASELKVKESNRLDVMVHNLSKLGANITATEDGMIIEGGNSLTSGIIDSKLDHRIAMSFAVAGLVADGDVKILGADCVKISYPNFYEDLYQLYQ